MILEYKVNEISVQAAWLKTLYDLVEELNCKCQTYIDETYNGFKMNGASGYPISSLYWWYMFVKPNTTRININLMSDASDKVFAIFGDYHQYISFDGHNHKLKRINWSGSNVLALKDIILLGENNAVSCHVTATRFVANNVIFGDVAYGDSVVRELNVSANMPVKIVSIENHSKILEFFLYTFISFIILFLLSR